VVDQEQRPGPQFRAASAPLEQFVERAESEAAAPGTCWTAGAAAIAICQRAVHLPRRIS
jgi:hypothetical protein